MKALIDFDGAGTLVANTKTLVSNAILAHNADENAHTDTFVTKIAGKDLSTNDFTDALKNKLDAVATDTYVQKINGKTLSTNDFTDEDKAKLDSLSTDTQTVDLTGVMRVYIGSVAPTDTSVIWFDTSAYSD